MKKIFLAILFIPLIGFSQIDLIFNSPVKLFTLNNSSQVVATLNHENTINLTLDSVKYDSILTKKPNYLQIELPFFSNEIVFELKSFNVVNTNLKIRSITENSVDYINISPNLLSYTIILNEKELGIINFVNDEIIGTFILNDKQYELTSFNGTYVLFETNNSINKSNFQCHVQNEINLPSNNLNTELSDSVCIEFSLEIDNFTRQTFNSNQEAINWATAIFTGVSQIYNSQTIASLTIVDFQIWNTTDPYVNLSTTQEILYEMQDYWIENNDNIERDLAHLISKRPLGGGIAFVDALCSDTWGYGFSADLNNITTFNFPNPSYTWNLNCISHEIGHNVGSNHTHNCDWNPDISLAFGGGAIDNCVDVEGTCLNNPQTQIGTIMSYCHLDWNGGVVLNFHPVVLSQALNPGIQSADCLESCAPPTWNCENGSCIEQSDGSGNYNSLNECLNSCICTQNEIVLNFLPDCYGEETSWDLIDENNQVLYSVSEYPGQGNLNGMENDPQLDQHIWCLEDGCYTFIVYDLYGDGMNGSNPNYDCGQDGDFSILDDDYLIASLQNANFGEVDSNFFCLEQINIYFNCTNLGCVESSIIDDSYSTLEDCEANCTRCR